MSDQKRLWISFLAGLLALAVLFIFIPSQPIVPRGIFLPAKDNQNKQIVSPSEPVNLYSIQPENGKILGTIHIEMHSVEPTQAGENQVVEYARNMARQNGANGIVVTQFGHTPPGSIPAPLAIYSFHGTAIQTRSQS